jgi:hypothetical protein
MTWQKVGEMARWPALVTGLSLTLAGLLSAAGFETKAAHELDMQHVQVEHHSLVAMVQDTKWELRRISEQNKRIICKLTEMQSGKIDPSCAE